jgi:hypothetical protein
MRRSDSAAMRRPPSTAVIVVMTIVALCLPLSLAFAASAFGQEPEPPGGGPQEPTGTDTTPTTTTPTGGEQPTTTTGQLPRTGWDALIFFLAGVALLLAGARLRVLTRIKQVYDRVVHRRRPEVALREALEPIRAARLSPPRPDPDMGTLHVEPSTPTARRLTGVAPPLDIDY